MNTELEFIAQTAVVNYYREDGENILVYRRTDNQLLQGGVMAENDLVEHIVSNSIIKISESFAYDYKEILKEEIEPSTELARRLTGIENLIH